MKEAEKTIHKINAHWSALQCGASALRWKIPWWRRSAVTQTFTSTECTDM